MRFCPNCGSQVDDNAKFCTGCGEKLMQPAPAPQPQQPQYRQNVPQQPQQQYGQNVPPQAPVYGTPVNNYDYGQMQEPPKKKGKGLLIGAAAALGVCAVGGGAFLALRGLGASPAQEFLLYQKEALVDQSMKQMEENLDRLGSGKFTSDMTLSADVSSDNGLVGSMVTGMTKDSSVGLKLDASGSEIILNADLNLMGSPVLDGVITYNAGTAGFYIPALDDTYYTADLSKMMQKNGIDVDLSKVKLPEFTGKEWTDILTDYTAIVCSAVNDDNVTLEKKEDFTLEKLEADFTGNVYTWQPTEEDIQEMLEKLADHIDEDEKLRESIYKVADPEVVDMFARASGEDSFSFETFLDEQLKNAAQQIRDNAADTGKELVENEFTWTLYVADKKAKMIKIATKDGAGLIIEMDGDKEKDYSVAVWSEMSSDIDVRTSYTKDGSVYTGESTTTSSEGNVKTTFAIDESKKSVFGTPYGTYDIEMDALQGTGIHFEVAESENGGADHIISMNNLSSLSEGYVSSGTITLNATETTTAELPPSSAKTQDITDWDVNQLEDLFTKLGQSLEQNVLPNLTQAIGF